jgi:hypothetical protein
MTNVNTQAAPSRNLSPIRSSDCSRIACNAYPYNAGVVIQFRCSKPATHHFKLGHWGSKQASTRRCIGPTGSIDLTEAPRRMSV